MADNNNIDAGAIASYCKNLMQRYKAFEANDFMLPALKCNLISHSFLDKVSASPAD